MGYVTQQRPLNGVVLPPYKYYYGGYTYAAGPGYEILGGSQQTYSWRTTREQSAEMEYEQMSGLELKREVNREYRDRNDTGHEFWTERDSYSWSHPSISCDATNGVHYSGFLAVGTVAVSDRPDFSYPTATKVTVDGTEGVRRTYPTRPEAGVAAALGELRQEVPHLPGILFNTVFHRAVSPRRNLRATGGQVGRTVLPYKPGGSRRDRPFKGSGEALGDEYLNYQFGLMPTANDIERVARAVLKSSKAARQMQRDSGRAVRRRANLYDTQTSVSKADEVLSLAIGSVGGSPTPAGYLATYSPAVSVVDTVRQRAWFSGAYEYHLAEGHSLLQRMDHCEQLANRLLGTRITPDVIWQLTPWSWFADWFSDAGSFMENVTALSNDDLVMKYGYVMHETHAQRAWTSRRPLRSASGTVVANELVLTHDIIRKSRTRATPYGFGVDVSGLSPRRWAILGALGLTRSTGILRND